MIAGIRARPGGELERALLRTKAALILWRSGWDTLDISRALGISEADAQALLRAARDAGMRADDLPAGGREGGR